MLSRRGRGRVGDAGGGDEGVDVRGPLPLEQGPHRRSRGERLRGPASAARGGGVVAGVRGRRGRGGRVCFCLFGRIPRGEEVEREQESRWHVDATPPLLLRAPPPPLALAACAPGTKQAACFFLFNTQEATRQRTRRGGGRERERATERGAPTETIRASLISPLEFILFLSSRTWNGDRRPRRGAHAGQRHGAGGSRGREK